MVYATLVGPCQYQREASNREPGCASHPSRCSSNAHAADRLPEPELLSGLSTTAPCEKTAIPAYHTCASDCAAGSGTMPKTYFRISGCWMRNSRQMLSSRLDNT